MAGEAQEDAGAASPKRPTGLPGWASTGIYVFVGIATVTLLVLHTFSCSDCVTVDTTSLGLLAILLLLPLAPYITKLRAGELEAQIGHQDVRELREQAAELPSQGTTIHLNVPAQERRPTDPPSVNELVERDPPLGLAKLRMDLEQELNRLYFAGSREAPRRPLGIRAMARTLAQEEKLPPEVIGPLDEVSMLANRAVHGEFVPADVAREIAEIGTRILAILRSIDLNG